MCDYVSFTHGKDFHISHKFMSLPFKGKILHIFFPKSAVMRVCMYMYIYTHTHTEKKIKNGKKKKKSIAIKLPDTL